MRYHVRCTGFEGLTSVFFHCVAQGMGPVTNLAVDFTRSAIGAHGGYGCLFVPRHLRFLQLALDYTSQDVWMFLYELALSLPWSLNVLVIQVATIPNRDVFDNIVSLFDSERVWERHSFSFVLFRLCFLRRGALARWRVLFTRRVCRTISSLAGPNAKVVFNIDDGTHIIAYRGGYAWHW
jgi:hypothetical protein